ncbi:MAG: DUF1513 domain-containing protein [Cohaesibacter sp.]|nr:DUF1513 domain-containing protein [Cohaesibacter sp.]MCV6601609.1 DUF1513 domain-containing protein [Cohaesibacter sp.]
MGQALELDRRQLLAAGGATLLAGLIGPARDVAAHSKAFFASAVRMPDKSFAVQLLDERGVPLALYPLQDRGHDVAVSPVGRELVAFARRPGRFMLVMDKLAHAGPRLIWAREDRHYFGHGAFSADGRLLYAAENAFEEDSDLTHGVIGIYDVANGFKRIGEHLSHGIGPHEILLMGDDKTLVVANGGIMTHPDYRRVKLNLDDMKPNLAFLDVESGALLDQMELSADLHQLSIRHMSIDADQRVWFGCQHQGDMGDEVPLVGSYKRDGSVRMSMIPRVLSRSLRNYVGSVMCNGEGLLVATSCPRAGKVLYWEAERGTFVGETVLPDGCGLAAWGKGLVMSNGLGEFGRVTLPGEAAFEVSHRQSGLAFDNHMIAL